MWYKPPTGSVIQLRLCRIFWWHDLSAAFESYVIGGMTLSWITSYLTG